MAPKSLQVGAMLGLQNRVGAAQDPSSCWHRCPGRFTGRFSGPKLPKTASLSPGRSLPAVAPFGGAPFFDQLFSYRVSMPLGIAFWIHFWSILGPKIDPKSVQNRSQERRSKKSKNVKKKPLFFNVFCASEGSKINQKSTKNRFRKYLK